MTHFSKPVSVLRQRMIDGMTLRKLSPRTQSAYIRAVTNFTRFFGQSPDLASAVRCPPESGRSIVEWRPPGVCHEETSAPADDRFPTSEGLRRLHTYWRQGVVQCARQLAANCGRKSPEFWLKIFKNLPDTVVDRGKVAAIFNYG
jgi:hypothetical protein